MSVPLYNLVVVNERGRMGAAVSVEVDRYFENIIRGGVKRCYAFQLTVLVTGLALLLVNGMGITSLWSNIVIGLKTLFLLVLMGLLSYIHLRVQPRIDGHIESVQSGPIPEGVRHLISPLRLLRKRMAAVCLFIVITEVILGVQIFAQLSLIVLFILEAIAALFSWRAYSSLLRYGWI